MPNRRKPIGNTEETLLSRYEETQVSLQKIENAGYEVISIWGCEFRKLLRDNPDLKNEQSSHLYVKYSPINIRDTCKFLFPVGHPKVYIGAECP